MQAIKRFFLIIAIIGLFTPSTTCPIRTTKTKIIYSLTGIIATLVIADILANKLFNQSYSRFLLDYLSNKQAIQSPGKIENLSNNNSQLQEKTYQENETQQSDNNQLQNQQTSANKVSEEPDLKNTSQEPNNNLLPKQQSPEDNVINFKEVNRGPGTPIFIPEQSDLWEFIDNKPQEQVSITIPNNQQPVDTKPQEHGFIPTPITQKTFDKLTKEQISSLLQNTLVTQNTLNQQKENNSDSDKPVLEENKTEQLLTKTKQLMHYTENRHPNLHTIINNKETLEQQAIPDFLRKNITKLTKFILPKTILHYANNNQLLCALPWKSDPYTPNMHRQQQNQTTAEQQHHESLQNLFSHQSQLQNIWNNSNLEEKDSLLDFAIKNVLPTHMAWFWQQPEITQKIKEKIIKLTANKKRFPLFLWCWQQPEIASETKNDILKNAMVNNNQDFLLTSWQNLGLTDEIKNNLFTDAAFFNQLPVLQKLWQQPEITDKTKYEALQLAHDKQLLEWGWQQPEITNKMKNFLTLFAMHLHKISLVQWCWKQPEITNNTRERVIEVAIKKNQLPILQWCWQQPETTNEIKIRIIEASALKNQLPLLQWCWQQPEITNRIKNNIIIIATQYIIIAGELTKLSLVTWCWQQPEITRETKKSIKELAVKNRILNFTLTLMEKNNQKNLTQNQQNIQN